MNPKSSITTRITTILLCLWSVLFVVLIFAHLQVSFRLSELQSLRVIPTKLAPAVWNGVVPLEAKIAATVLVLLLLLIFWRKTRRYACVTVSVFFGFAPIAFGAYATLLAYLAKDLADFSECYTDASGALQLCM